MNNVKFAGRGRIAVVGMKNNKIELSIGNVSAEDLRVAVQAPFTVDGSPEIVVTAFLRPFMLKTATGESFVALSQYGSVRLEETMVTKYRAGTEKGLFRTEEGAMEAAAKAGIDYVVPVEVSNTSVLVNVGKDVTGLDRIAKQIAEATPTRRAGNLQEVAKSIKAASNHSTVTPEYVCLLCGETMGNYQTEKRFSNRLCTTCGVPGYPIARSIMFRTGMMIDFPAATLNVGMVRPFPGGMQPIVALHNWNTHILPRLLDRDVLASDVAAAELAARREVLVG
jgi:hypothetical protein